MKLICGPDPLLTNGTRSVTLFLRTQAKDHDYGGESIARKITQQGLIAAERAWDFLAIALSVAAADLAGHRSRSPDGWTRAFDITVCVNDPVFWDTQRHVLERALAFLTTDRWSISFRNGGFSPPTPKRPKLLQGDSIVLLSGGLDSLIGATELTLNGNRPIAVSHVVRGDFAQQDLFAKTIGGGLPHICLNHTIRVADPENPATQRARSIVFIAYGALIATTTHLYAQGDHVPLYICENGLIALNPPLTGIRIGSLSTRTAHPYFLRKIQSILDSASLRVRLHNPYTETTKGEMLAKLRSERIIRKLAHRSISCGRYRVHKYQHCGRCVPCQIRRASFLRAELRDGTRYLFRDLGRNSPDYRAFDDVRSVGLALAEIEAEGLEQWLGDSMFWCDPADRPRIQAMIGRGMTELETLHAKHRIR